MEMKQKRTKVVLSMLALAGLAVFSLFAVGGSLEPFAPPGPTMKTLDEVEPRIPIHATDLPLTINQSGSYYLAENITTSGNGININVDGVSLDLSGFTLAGGTGTGIYIEAKNVCVTNGTVAGWSGPGVNGFEALNSQFKNLCLYNNGSDGLWAGYGSIIKDCVARDNTGTGIAGEDGVVVSNCTAHSNDSDGIKVSSDGIVMGCTAKSNTGDGIQIGRRCLVQNNTITSNGSGIHVSGVTGNGNNRIKSNLICNNDVGLDIDTLVNYVADNTVKGNTDNYDIVAGNQLNILLCEVPETIDWPAMVTLAGTLTSTATDQHGITVNADDVTINLGGHSLIGPDSGTNYGIYMNGRSSVEIRNGTVRNFYSGIHETSVSLGRQHRVIDVRSVSNGQYGIFLQGENHLVKDCTASFNGDSATGSVVYGIYTGYASTITGNIANDNGRSSTCDYVYGICAGHRNTVTGNTACNNGYSADSRIYGISTGNGSTVNGNTACLNGYHSIGSYVYVYGIDAQYGCTVIGNTAHINGISTSGGAIYGIRLGGHNLVDQNTAYDNFGINMNSPGTCTFGTNHAP